MKHYKFGLALLFVFTFTTVRAEDPENLLEAYVKAGTPGAMHKKLSRWVGEWTFVGKFWMDPEKEPMEMKGEAKRTWTLDGRFVQDVVTSNSFGPFKGIGTTGYDNTKKKYVSSWTDSMSTSITLSTGTVDKSGKVWTFKATMLDPVTKKKIKARDVITFVNENEQKMTSYHLRPGMKKEVKVMEAVYTRKKK